MKFGTWLLPGTCQWRKKTFTTKKVTVSQAKKGVKGFVVDVAAEVWKYFVTFKNHGEVPTVGLVGVVLWCKVTSRPRAQILHILESELAAIR